MAPLQQCAELAQLRHHVVFYDVGDNIHDNRNGKNSGEKFKDTGDFYKIAVGNLKYAKRHN